MNYNYAKNPLELKIKVVQEETETSKDAAANAKNQIVTASFYLSSIFKLIRASSQKFQSYAENNELEQFCDDLTNICDIGGGVANAIWEATENIKVLESPKTFDLLNEDKERKSDAETLAEKISYLLLSNEVPPPISNGLSSVMTEFYNNQADQSEIDDFESSPAYISYLLKSSQFFTVDGERTEVK